MSYSNALTRPGWLLGLVAVGMTLAASPACADPHEHGSDGDWLVFLTGEARLRSNADIAPGEDYDFASADVLYSHSSGPFRVLGEVFAASPEVDIERLQVGWEFGENRLLWLGRFHQPSSAWNTEHHHGQYLQTAITRPNIERWEDEGGVIPQHVAGALLETRGALGDRAGLALAVGGGAAPVIAGGVMVPIGPFHINPGGYRPSWTARIGLLPEALGEDTVGIVLARHDVNIRDPAVVTLLNADDALLDVTGAFAQLSPRGWHVQAAYYDVQIALSTGPQLRHEHFGAGYAQLEHVLPHSLTAFGRVETTDGAGNVSYVTYQRQEFTLRRGLGGLRWDFARRQALTVEAGRSATLLGHSNEVRLQWSGVLP